jgi:hypothetical protein
MSPCGWRNSTLAFLTLPRTPEGRGNPSRTVVPPAGASVSRPLTRATTEARAEQVGATRRGQMRQCEDRNAGALWDEGTLPEHWARRASTWVWVKVPRNVGNPSR